MDNEEFIQQASAYATGALQGEELKRFEGYLRTASKDELSQLAELAGTASLLPLALERKSPPPRVKEKVMQKVQLAARAQDAVHRRTDNLSQNTPAVRRNWIPVGIVAVLGMIALFSLFALRLLNTIDDQNKQLVAVEQDRKQLQTQLVALKDEVIRKEELLKVLASRRIEITVMDGMKTSPVSYGKIIWDPEKRTAILQVSDLPPAPSGKDYQLWVIKDKKPISAGVFAVSNTESNYFKIENLAVTNPKEIGAFAVTLEPKGGLPQPTGEMYIAGSPKL